MNVAVLIPARSDGGRRDALLTWTTGRLRAEHPDHTIAVGHHEIDEGPFNRSAAVNRAAAQAGPADVYVVADGDSFVGARQLDAAVQRASDTGRITFAYDRFNYLNRAMSDQVMAGYQGDWHPGVEWALHGTCSSMVCVPADLFDQVGGFDEGFVGWGMEDIGFSLACQALGGGMERIEGAVWHLHHPMSPENHQQSPLYQANVARMRRYEAADYDPDAMRALLADLRA